MRMRVSIPLSLLCLLTACSQTEVIPDPVVVEVVRIERTPVPGELLVPIPKQGRPEGEVTFGDAVALWAEDRATIDALNGRLRAIASLDNE